MSGLAKLAYIYTIDNVQQIGYTVHARPVVHRTPTDRRLYMYIPIPGADEIKKAL